MLPRLLWIVEPTVWRAVFEEPVKAEGFLAHDPKRHLGEGEVAVLGEKMERGRVSTVFIAFLLAVSIVGLAQIPVLVLQPNLEDFQFSVRHSLVGALYSAVCLLGVAAIFYPAKCRGMFQKTQNPLPEANKPSSPVQIEGHHPGCQNYSGNRITVGGRVFCAACSGLLVGAIIALIGAAFYFFVGLNVAWGSVWLVVLGEIWMFLGLAQIKYGGYVKVILNVIFVVGSFVTLVETDVLGKSVLVDLYVLGLIGFLLWFRVLLSEWNNKRICQTCQSCFQ